MSNCHYRAPLYLLAFLLTTTLAYGSDPTAPRLRASFVTPGDPSTRRFVLEWDAVANAAYQVQAAANLDSGTPWKTIDVIVPTGNLGIFKLTPEKADAGADRLGFFRIALPQPEMFAIEPAILPVAVESTIHVVGQCFSENMELRVGPRALTNREIINPNLMRATFTPATPGTYVFELVVADRVLHTFTVFAVDTAGNRDLLSQEVPNLPPASPTKSSSYAMYSIQKGVRTAYDPPTSIRPPPNVMLLLDATRRSKTTEAKVVLGGIKTSEESFRAEIDSYSSATPYTYSDFTGLGLKTIPHFSKYTRRAKTSEAIMNLRTMNNWPGTFEVQPFSAELQHQVVDMMIPGVGIDLVWGRCYRSQTGPNTAMGKGWTHYYDIRVEEAGADLVLHDGTGRRDLFIQQADGTYRRDGFFYEITRDAANRVKVKFPWLGEWNFHSFDGSATAGKILSSSDANGNTMTFAYGSPGLLTEIIDTLGRTHRIIYRDSGGTPVVSALTDSQGRVIVTYELSDSTGDLVSVRTLPVTGTPNGNDFPDGKVTTYVYSGGFADERLNHNIIRVIDPAGQPWLSVAYRPIVDPANGNFDAVDFVQRGRYRTHLRRFPITPTPSNDFAVVKAIINDSGNVSELSFDARHRCLLELEYTGRANPDLPTTQTQNRPAGKLRPCDGTGNPCDPDYFETRAKYNRDDLCTSLILPRGNSVRYLYGRDFDKNANPRKTGDLLVVRELPVINALDPDSDDDGVLDSTERVWRFEIDPRFGSPAMALRRYNKPKTIYDRFATGPRQTTSMDGSFSHRFTSTTPNIGHPDRFVTRTTDPLGNVTIITYDAAGNPMRVHFNPKEISVDKQFAYNSRGQLTAITNAPDANGDRRVDTATYYDSGPQAGYLREFIVDAQGPVVTRVTYEYDPRGNVIRITDPRGFSTDITYNQLDQPVQTQSPPHVLGTNLRNTTDFTYDANDNIVQIDYDNRDGNGVLDAANPKWTTQCRYDLLNRMTDCWVDKDGSLVLICEQVQHDAFDNVVLYRSPEAVNGRDPNAIVRFEYDERNLLFRQIRGPGTPDQSVEQIDYTANGLKSVQWEPHRAPGLNTPELARTAYAYDGFDRLISVIDPMGNEARYAYDDNDNLVLYRGLGELDDVPGSARNLPYHEWRWRYNSRDLPVISRELHFDPDTQAPIGDGESTHTFTYAPNGQLLSETDDNGHTTRYSYDTVGRLQIITDPRTNRLTYAYDPSGNVLSATEINRSDLGGPEQMFVTTYTYDPLGRCTSRTDNVGNNENWLFDSRDLCLRHVDPAGNTTVWTYDGLGRVTAVIVDVDRDGSPDLAVDSGRRFIWDDNSRLVAEIDDNTNTTTYAYDSLDRKTLATSPDGASHTFTWNSRHNLVSSTDPNGTMISNRFDLLNRCVTRDISPGPGVATTTTFEEFAYDGASRLVRTSNDVSQTQIAYDSLGNPQIVIQDGWQMLGAFDAEGNRKALTYPSGRVLQYTHDSLNRTISVAQFLGARPAVIARFAYEGPDRLAGIARANGVNTRITWDGAANEPNAPGDLGWKQVSRFRHAVAGSPAIIHQGTNRWDAAQNRAARDNHLQGAVDVMEALRFAYDGGKRLVQSQRSTDGMLENETTYTLDGNGNRIAVSSGGAVMPYTMDATLPEPADFQMDQYTVTPFGGQQYDRNGNLTVRDQPGNPTYYQYDYADRLVAVSAVGSDGMPQTVVSFAYDALGRRVGKTTYPAAPMAPVTASYIYDIDDDCDGTDEVIEERLTGRPPIIYTSPSFARLTMTVEGVTYYHHEDDLGNVVALTDSGGRVVERYRYSDFGEVTFLNADGAPLVSADGLPVSGSPVGNRFFFRGMERDEETGFYNNKDWNNDPYAESICRSYDPGTGRYLSRKGVKESVSLGLGRSSAGHNSFSFAADNPWSSGRKLIGRAKFSNIDLKQGLTGRPVGQPSSAGLGAHVQRASQAGSRNDGVMDAYKVRFAYWPHMHQYGRMKGKVKFFNETKGFGRARLLESIQEEGKSFSSLIR